MTRSTNPLDESTTFGFNNAGVQTTVTNALNETTTSNFDDAGRLLAFCRFAALIAKRLATHTPSGEKEKNPNRNSSGSLTS